MTFTFDKNLISVILKSKIMDQKNDTNELISRMIRDGCQLIIIWLKKRRNQPKYGLVFLWLKFVNIFYVTYFFVYLVFLLI